MTTEEKANRAEKAERVVSNFITIPESMWNDESAIGNYRLGIYSVYNCDDADAHDILALMNDELQFQTNLDTMEAWMTANDCLPEWHTMRRDS